MIDYTLHNWASINWLKKCNNMTSTSERSKFCSRWWRKRHCITRVTSTQVGWKKHHFLLNLSYVTLIKSFICSSRIELKYWIVDVCEEKDTRLPGWVSAHGEQSDERETSSGNCQHFQVLPPGLYPFGKIRPKFTNIVLVKNTLKIPHLKIAHQGGRVSGPQNMFPRVFDL